MKMEKTIGPCTLRIDCRCKECSKFEAKASIQVSSGVKREAHTMGKKHNHRENRKRKRHRMKATKPYLMIAKKADANTRQ